MMEKETELSQQEEKKRRSASIMNAVLIGVLIGIIFYSIAKNSLGFLTLIPLFIIFKLVNKKDDEKQ